MCISPGHCGWVPSVFTNTATWAGWHRCERQLHMISSFPNIVRESTTVDPPKRCPGFHELRDHLSFVGQGAEDPSHVLRRDDGPVLEVVIIVHDRGRGPHFELVCTKRKGRVVMKGRRMRVVMRVVMLVMTMVVVMMRVMLWMTMMLKHHLRQLVDWCSRTGSTQK
jgi:hypothetical protein